MFNDPSDLDLLEDPGGISRLKLRWTPCFILKLRRFCGNREERMEICERGRGDSDLMTRSPPSLTERFDAPWSSVT